MSGSNDTFLRRAGQLAGQLAERATPDAADWLRAQLAAGAAGRNAFLTAFSSAGRRLGTAAVDLDGSAAGLTASESFALSGRGLDELGRIALLVAELGRIPGEQPGRAALVRELFDHGSVREKQAVLRALALLANLPAPAAEVGWLEELIAIGVDACRSSVQGVFDAIACENLFPAERFSEAEFNQLVLKALFIATPCARIAGLDRRIGPELIRMVQGYASERRAAGRAVPADIELITGPARSAQ